MRKLGLAFYAFNPLVGGLLARKPSTETKVEAGSRFDPERTQGQNYRKRYWNDHYFDAIKLIDEVATKHNLTLLEVALRWMNHHSELKAEFGDNVLIGASSVAHLESNLVDLEKGPLPDEVVEVLDQAWDVVRPVASKVNASREPMQCHHQANDTPLTHHAVLALSSLADCLRPLTFLTIIHEIRWK